MIVAKDSASAAWQLQTSDLSKFNRDCNWGTDTVQKWTPEVLLFPTRYGTGTADAEQSPPNFVPPKGTVGSGTNNNCSIGLDSLGVFREKSLRNSECPLTISSRCIFAPVSTEISLVLMTSVRRILTQHVIESTVGAGRWAERSALVLG